MSQAHSTALEDLRPQLLFHAVGAAAHFATWRLAEGHESLALFTSIDSAEKYRASLPEPAEWRLLEPARDKLIEILQACRAAGIVYASLDPIDGSARPLLHFPKVLKPARPVTPPE